MIRLKTLFCKFFSPAGCIEAKAFWREAAIWFAGTLIAALLLSVVISFAVPGAPEKQTAFANGIMRIFGAVCVIRMAVLSRRRLRDAGYSAKCYFWLLLPIVGAVAFIARLCEKTCSN